jgi:hypothetical protein
MRRIVAVGLVVLFAGLSSAIVIVPPLVYVASLSILSVVTNMFIAFFFWFAVQGFAGGKILGKPLHSILYFILPLAGRLATAFFFTVLFSAVFSPIELPEIAFVSGLTMVFTVATVCLSNYRAIRNSEHRLRQLAGIVAFSIIVFMLCFLAVKESTQVTVLVKAPAGKSIGAAAQSSLISDKVLAPSMAAKPSQDEAVSSRMDYAAEPKPKSDAFVLWLSPTSGEPCMLTVQTGSSSQTRTYVPHMGCYTDSDTGLKRVFCPIKVTPSDMPLRGDVELVGGGSCFGHLRVRILSDRFEVTE